MAGIIMRQAIMMLLLNVVGMVAYYTKIINAEGGRQLSKLVLQIVNPVLVVMAYIEVECSAKMIRNLFWTFGLAIVVYILSIALVTLLIREKEGRETAIERFSAIYSNCGFMGIPLANALLGLEGVFYVTAFLTIFNLFAWTHGIMLLTEKRDIAFAYDDWNWHWFDFIFCQSSNSRYFGRYDAVCCRLKYTAGNDCFRYQCRTSKCIAGIAEWTDLLCLPHQVAVDSGCFDGRIPPAAVCTAKCTADSAGFDRCAFCCDVHATVSAA